MKLSEASGSVQQLRTEYKQLQNKQIIKDITAQQSAYCMVLIILKKVKVQMCI